MMKMGYIKMVLFYFFELVGAFINFLGSIFNYYPALDLGVNYLLFVEGKKINKQREERSQQRQEKEQEASSIEAQAYEVDGDGTHI